jgi:hypothetical protein
MLSHIASDLHQAYLEEVFKPQLGKPGASTPPKPKSSSDLDGDGNVDSFEKKVRQFIYDIRHLMRKNNIPVERAFQIRSSKTNYGADVIKTAKEKLNIRGGGSTSVSEEILSEDDKVGIVVNYKNGTTYRKSVSRDSVQQELQKFRSNPNVSSVEQTGYGLAKKDYDGDGKIESPSKEHAGAVHNAIQRATGGTPDGKDTRGKTSKKKLKSYGVREGFSNWRDDLCEIVGEIENKKQTQITDKKKVDNYKSGNVTLNPQFSEDYSFEIVEETILTEEYLTKVVDVASEFFYNYGLNENGVDIVIEELGEEKFTEFVFELSEEYFLSEELKKSESKVKKSKAPKGTKQYSTTIARVKKQGGTTMSAKDRVASTIRKDKVKTAVEKAKEIQAPSDQPRKKSIKDRVAGFILKGIERDRAARQTASKLAGQTAQTLRKAASVGSRAASEFGKGFSSGIKGTASATQKTKKAVVGEEYIEEKAESEQQQKLFGLALSVKRGDTPRSEASDEVLEIVDTMSEKKIRDFASTPHSEVPKKKVTEAIANPEGVTGQKSPRVTQRQKDAVNTQLRNKQRQYKIGEDVDNENSSMSAQQLSMLKQKTNIAKRLADLRQRELRKQKPQQNPQVQNQSYEPEGEVVDELTRFEKEKGKDFRTGKPSTPGGTWKNDPVMKHMNKVMGSARMGVQPRGKKKEPGKKPPAAGEVGSGVSSPAQKVQGRRAAAERARKFVQDTRGT